MRRFARACIGSTALALGIGVVPMTAMAGGAAQAAISAARPAGQFHSQHATLSPPRLVNLRAAGHAAGPQHPHLKPPFRYFNPAAVTAGRAAAVDSGGRRSGVTALAGVQSGVQAVSPGQTWADFPAMSLSRQISLLGGDQALQPPDTQVAAGPGAVLEATNDSLSVWSKTGSLLEVSDLNKVFPVPSTQSFTDPRVLYDTQSSRWILSGWSLDSSLTNSLTYLAVSATSDPTGNWLVYTVASSSSVLTDQPMTGVCDDKVVVSWNAYINAGTFSSGAQTMVLQKSSLLSGSSVNADVFTSGSEFRLVPAQSLSPTTTCWMTVNKADALLDGSSTAPTLGVVAITGTPASNVTLTETDLSLTSPASLPPAPWQPSGTTNDAGIDDRLLSAVWRNGVLWTSGTDACTPGGDSTLRDCLRLWKVDTSSASPSLLLDKDLSQSGTDLYYPAVSLDSSGDVFVSYSASSPTQFPGAYAAISPSTASGAFSAPVTIAAGRASYYDGGSSPRWGDYSAAAPDPSLPGAVWVAGEYAPSNAGSGYWATAAAEISLTTPPRVAVAVGAEGTNGALWVQAPQLGGGWHSLGGKIAGPPAVAAAPDPDGASPAQPLFIATGGNKELYLRSLAAGWRLLGPRTASCLGGPAAVIAGGTLTVACRGLDNALWVNAAPVPSSGLPQFTRGWARLGGVLSAGPAAAPVGGVMTFFARGTDGRIYTRTLASGWRAMPWACTGAPAAAAEAAGSDTVFACQGAGHALVEAAGGGAGWGGAVSLGGALVGGPAVAAASRAAELLAEGTDHAVWERTPLTGWASLGGSVVGGVGAAALN